MKSKIPLPIFILLFLSTSLFISTSAQQNTSAVNTNTNLADIGLELSVNNVSPTAGTTVIFTIIVANQGPGNASAVTVKNKLPDGYIFSHATASAGNFSNSTGLWTIGNIDMGTTISLALSVIVKSEGDHMVLAEIMSSSLKDPDSKPADGVDTDKDNFVVDDPDDDDDGDGQDVKVQTEEETSTTSEKPPGIKAVLHDNKNRTQSYFFDPNSIAMRIDVDEKGKQSPIYFDNAGYVYTAGKKNQYVKVPFEKMKKMMAFPSVVSGGVLPPLDFPDGSVKYYGMDVSPKKFPILEWAFVYQRKHFEGNTDFTKETITCRGENNCTKYIMKDGKDAGSFVLFDSKNRLAEIFSINSGNAVYTYEDVTVKLPNATEMPFMTDMFN